MKHPSRVLALAALLSVLPIHGRTLAPVEFDRVLSESAIVAVVLVESARRISGINGSDCGVVYTAKVQRSVKNSKVGDELTFGNYRGRLVGSLYLIFLSTAGARYDYTYLPFVGDQPSPSEIKYRENCDSVLPALRESYDGLSTLSVAPSGSYSWRLAVRLNSSRQVVPQGVHFEPEPGAVRIDELVLGPVQIELDSFLRKCLELSAKRE